MSDKTKPILLLQKAIGYHRSGNFSQASKLYRKFLTQHPDNADALHFLGILESQNGNYAESVKLISRAVHLMEKHSGQNPNYCNAANNLGNALKYQGKPDLALSSYKKALKVEPLNVVTINSTGNALKDLGRFAEAETYFRQAVRLKPDYADAYANLGNSLREQGHLPEAVIAYRKATSLDPGHAGAHNNLAIALLSTGDFENGWKEYEWRWQANQWKPRPYRFPVWNGESLNGRNILVYSEQGIGDEIMFSSCYPELCSIAGNVIIECDPRLEPLFRRSFATAICRGIDRENSDTSWLSDVPVIDVQIPAGSIPLHLRPGLESFPQHQGYLRPDPEQARRWKSQYAELGRGYKVGISWRGGTCVADKKARSLDLKKWAEIFRIPDTQFINLQYGECGEEISAIREQLGVHIHDWDDADPLSDMDSFIAQIKSLDLVISVDNSTVHAAGSVGTEAWAIQR
ncbi:MAG TPA: tetratricopeptide repeat protein [Gammaproteobacteria bacterium]|mgnify:CR=1 FL=1|nr:tetratricopeptide repeat protein [Gammaproteobacteria bacterium]